jgi:hypothetical protein
VLDAPAKVISMRWDSDGLLECPTEMMLAQPSEPSECDQRYLLVEMFFEV